MCTLQYRPQNMPRAFAVVESGIMTALLEIKFPVSKNRHRERVARLWERNKQKRRKAVRVERQEILTSAWKHSYSSLGTKSVCKC